LGKLFTPICLCHHNPAKGRWCSAAGKVTAGLSKSSDSLPPGGWLIVTCKLTACTPGSAPGPTLGNEYGRHLPFYPLLCHIACMQSTDKAYCYRCHTVWSVCLSVCAGHIAELCKNGWTYWDVIWATDLCVSKEPCIRGGCRSLTERGIS